MGVTNPNSMGFTISSSIDMSGKKNCKDQMRCNVQKGYKNVSLTDGMMGVAGALV